MRNELTVYGFSFPVWFYAHGWEITYRNSSDTYWFGVKYLFGVSYKVKY